MDFLQTLGSFCESFLLKELEGVSDSLKIETKNYFNKGVREYLYHQGGRIRKVKTLLFRNEPVDLYTIYQPLKIIHAARRNIVNTQSINEVFKHSQLITLIGTAGSGKSTLIKHLFLNSIEENFAIPVLVELRQLNESDESLTEYLLSKILKFGIAIDDSIVKRLLNAGRFVFFFDGYDETLIKKRNSLLEDVKEFVYKYSKNRYLISSRPYSNVEFLSDFHNYYVEPLSIEEVLQLIERQPLQKELKSKIKDSIQGVDISHVQDFLTNPLLLTLYIITYRRNSKIPEERSVFYRRVIDTLFFEHDSISKVSYEREIKCGLSHETIEEILKRFSFLSFFDGKVEFDGDYIIRKMNQIEARMEGVTFELSELIEDLKVGLVLWVEDGGYYSFIHRSIQEYFTAKFISEISEKNSEVVYGKIRNNLIFKLAEITNFIGLVKEIDRNRYDRFLVLKAIDEILQSNEDFEGLFRSFFSYLCFPVKGELGLEYDAVGKGEILMMKDDLIFLENYSRYPFFIILSHEYTKVYNSLFQTIKAYFSTNFQTLYKYSYPILSYGLFWEKVKSSTNHNVVIDSLKDDMVNFFTSSKRISAVSEVECFAVDFYQDEESVSLLFQSCRHEMNSSLQEFLQEITTKSEKIRKRLSNSQENESEFVGMI